MHADDLLPGDTPLRLIDQDGGSHPDDHQLLPPTEPCWTATAASCWRAGSTTRPARWSGRAGSRCTPRRTARRRARSPRRWCCAPRTGSSRPTGTRVAVVDTRRRPGRGADAAARRLALRLRPARAPRRAAVHAAGDPVPHAVGLAHAARLRGEDTVALALLGDGAHQRGRLPRGAELRGRLAGAGGLPGAEQRVRDLGAARQADRARPRSPTRPSATACRAVWSTATTSPRCYATCSARRSTRARARRRPDARSRPSPTAWRRTPTPTTRPATATEDEVTPGSPATRSRRLRDLAARAAAPSTTTRRPSSPPSAERIAAALRERHERRAGGDPDELFAHVYAEHRRRSCASRRRCCGRAGRRRPR